jgi:hypothetical protein
LKKDALSRDGIHMIANDLERICNTIEQYDLMIHEAGEFKRQPVKELLAALAFLNAQYVERAFLAELISELCPSGDQKMIALEYMNYLESKGLIKAASNNQNAGAAATAAATAAVNTTAEWSGYVKLKVTLQFDMQVNKL